MGRFKMPPSSGSGDVIYRDKRLRLEYRLDTGARMISCDFRDFHEGKTLYCEITLEQPMMDTIAVATPWKGRKAFLL